MLVKGHPFFTESPFCMKHIIDIDAWERRDNYGFFRSFVNSWYSVTTEIDCTEASAAARAAKRSFFLYYLYAVVRSANEVDELRYRTDKEGRVVFHDRVDIISPIAVPGKTFYTVRIPYHEDFERFYAEAHALITDIPEDGDPYGAEKILARQGDYDVVHLSAVPKMYFTSITYTLAEAGNGCSYPLMTAGKGCIPRRPSRIPPFHLCEPCLCRRFPSGLLLRKGGGVFEGDFT